MQIDINVLAFIVMAVTMISAVLIPDIWTMVERKVKH